jgi:hypothetical protein
MRSATSTTVLIALLLQACVATQPCCGAMTGTCGLTLGEPINARVTQVAPRPRTDWYLGMASVSAGLMAVGIGTGYAVQAANHRDDAASDSINRNVLLDKADAANERTAVGLAVGVPLLALGAIFLWLTPNDEPLREVAVMPPAIFGDADLPAEVAVAPPAQRTPTSP